MGGGSGGVVMRVGYYPEYPNNPNFLGIRVGIG